MIPEYEKYTWSQWLPMPSPNEFKLSKGLDVPGEIGIYQVRNFETKQRILFGEGLDLKYRTGSLFPPPYGSGTRNNMDKRNYILANWPVLQFRIHVCKSQSEAKAKENVLKSYSHHKFNT